MTRLMTRSTLCLALATAFALPTLAHAQAAAAQPAASAQAEDARLAGFDAYVDAVRKQFEVPGIAVAIVEDGRIVYERGFGPREVGKPAQIDEHTMFAIASNTKAFTSTALSMLADEGKLSLDDRVIDHLPWFRMSDAYVTREMRIKDLLAHRSGLTLGAGDLLYWPTTTYTTEEVARRLKDVPLGGSFRGQYAYDNILFGVAQLVIEQASGMKYEDFLRQRIFTPLGMNETRFNSDRLTAKDNVATGYALADFKNLEPAPRMTWHNVSGAGGIYSSVHDLSKWMNMHLAGGTYTDAKGNEHQLVSKKRQQGMWTIVTPIPVNDPSVPELRPGKPNFLGYGEGWQLSDYSGNKLVWHTGGWPGMVSRLTLVPDKKIGVIVLTSQEVGAAFNAVTMQALDAMLGTPKHDWLDAYTKAVAKSKSKADEDMQKHVAARDANAKPSLPLASYSGTYRDPWYGDIDIKNEGGKLVMRFTRTPDMVGDMEPWQHDTFVVRWRQRWLNADAFVNFDLDADGKIQEVRMDPMSPLTDFSFDFQGLRMTPVEAKE